MFLDDFFDTQFGYNGVKTDEGFRWTLETPGIDKVNVTFDGKTGTLHITGKNVIKDKQFDYDQKVRISKDLCSNIKEIEVHTTCGVTFIDFITYEPKQTNIKISIK